MASSDSQDDFVSLKNAGNEQFKLKKYDEAISYYSKAIAIKDDEPVAYTNRALCYIYLKKYFEAKEDCDKAISLDPRSVKAYYRRATVMRELLRFGHAIEDLQKVSTLDPSFKLAIKELKDIQDLTKEDKRITIEPMDKPHKFRSKNPVKMFDLNNQYHGTKSYGNPVDSS